MGTINANELLRQRYEMLPLKKPFSKLLGGLPKNTKWNMLLHGIAGSGKSTYSILLALSLAKYGRILYGNFEEAPGPTLINKVETIKKKYSNWNFARAMKGHMNKLNFLDYNTEENFWNMLENNIFKFVIVDSISQIANTETKMFKFWHHSLEFSDTSFIYIIHSRRTKDGKRESDYKGSSTIGHLVDINQRVVDGVVWNDKNRFLGQDCSTSDGFHIWTKKEVKRLNKINFRLIN